MLLDELSLPPHALAPTARAPAAPNAMTVRIRPLPLRVIPSSLLDPMPPGTPERRHHKRMAPRRSSAAVLMDPHVVVRGHLRVELDVEVDPPVPVDAVQMSQVLSNLARNAVEAMAAKPGTPAFTTRRSARWPLA
jgi:signal transduction histidine kinase